MTVYTVVAPTPISFSGLAPTSASVFDVEAPDPIQFDGLPPVPILADTEVAYSTPDAVRARVLNADGDFIRHLTSLDGLRTLDEFNTAGAGSIDITRVVPADVLAAGNQIIVAVGYLDVFRIVLDSEPGYRIEPVTQTRIDAWAGMGALGVLNAGMVIPEYGWRAEATEDRSFDYGSNPSIGGWLVGREWKTPIGKAVRSSWRWWYKKRHLPRGWPEKKAQWLWWRNPDAKSSVDETCYFRSSFTITQDRRVKFWVCGDDTLEFQLDGEVRLTQGPGGWKKPATFVINLSAGTHYVAAKVSNRPASTGNQNRSGFLCAIARIDGDGNVTKWLRRSGPSTWTVRRQLSAAPGWRLDQVLRQLVNEQKARGCASHADITFGFSATTDSAGRAWTGRHEVSIPIGTYGLDWVQQLVELGIDVHMSPALRLDAWRSRGSDRSKTVRIGQGADGAPLDESGSPEAPIRNVVYGRSRNGWVGVSHAGSVATRGRRETMATLGSARSSAQTATTLGRMLPDLAAPPQTFQITISGAAGGFKPYKHFNNGDWVSAHRAGMTSGWTRCRVLSIGLEVNPAGHPDYTVTLIED